MPAAPKSILIVEDDEDLRRMFRTALSLAGYEVREAGDGTAALRHLHSEPPDLIVLDLVLPTLDGVSVLSEVAGSTRTRHIPVIIVTGWTRDDLDNLDVGCVLRKPVTAEQLLHAVERCLASGAPGAGS